jgi:hypothetical protein
MKRADIPVDCADNHGSAQIELTETGKCYLLPICAPSESGHQTRNATFDTISRLPKTISNFQLDSNARSLANPFIDCCAACSERLFRNFFKSLGKSGFLDL